DGQPEATACALRNGKLFTGDVGYLDDDHDLWVVNRRTDLIVTGGENVYPAEVEAVLLEHPAVAQACVVGVPDEEWGKRVAAVVVPKAGAPLSAKALDAFCEGKLARFKRPRSFHFVEALPTTNSGKVDRRTLIERLSS
ncbi:MAG TPA: 2-succinylbenzoate-CoA ligase, partial [Candidatus Bipolaricaulota bacterium]